MYEAGNCNIHMVVTLNLRYKCQLRWKKLSDSHQLENAPGVVQLDWVVGEPAGDVALPVEDAHSYHRPHQHRAVAECRPCPVMSRRDYFQWVRCGSNLARRERSIQRIGWEERRRLMERSRSIVTLKINIEFSQMILAGF